MIPLPLRLILVIVATFVGVFTCCMILAKVSAWFLVGAVDKTTILGPALIISVILAAITASAAGFAYDDSVEVKAEKSRMFHEAEHQVRRNNILEQADLRQLQAHLDNTHQLPAKNSEIPTIPRIGR